MDTAGDSALRIESDGKPGRGGRGAGAHATTNTQILADQSSDLQSPGAKRSLA